MERRELLKLIAILTGGVVVGGDVFLSGCNTKAGAAAFSAADISLLDEVGETIIPTTDTPGAKAAKIGEFMKTIVSDCYTENQQKAFTSGISALDAACKKATGKSFAEASAQQRHDFLVALEKEAKEFNKKVEEEEKKIQEASKKENEKKSWTDQVTVEGLPRHYYTMMKQLTLWGYFTSETGATKALRHVAVPGRFDGAMPYAKGEKAWG